MSQELAALADVLDSAFFGRGSLSESEADSIIGGLYAIATALNRVADAIEGTPDATGQED